MFDKHSGAHPHGHEHEGASAGVPADAPANAHQPARTTVHPHTHSHGHSHTHSHARASRNRLAAALAITGIVLIAELVGGALSNSLSLYADAGHMAVDGAGLFIALIATHLMAAKRTSRRTWGWARAEVLAAILQAGMLIVICLTILWEAIDRFRHPSSIEGPLMAAIGAIGLVANLISLAILRDGQAESLNLKAAVLEVATDAFSSVAVIAAALVYLWTGWPYADAIVSILIAVLIVPRAFTLLRQSLQILLEQTPVGLNLDDIEQRLLQYPQVVAVHDIHASTINTGLVTLTAHVVVEDSALAREPYMRLVHELQRCLREDFPVSINHSTLQIDSEQHSEHEALEH